MPAERLMHYMDDDRIAAACGSPGDTQGLLTTNIPGYVTCPDCQAITHHEPAQEQ